MGGPDDVGVGIHAPKDYTSGSESDEEVFIKHGTANNPGAIKKKKRKVPPQESIDRMWRRFSSPKFGRTLAILPFEPVAASATPERGNELLSEGYERAVAECRRKVRKIIQECRRVNMRYQDKGWDLVRPFTIQQLPLAPDQPLTFRGFPT